MTDSEKKEQLEPSSPVKNLVEKILPEGSVSDIKNVLGGTTVDTRLDDFSAQPGGGSLSAPMPSAIPKRPEGSAATSVNHASTVPGTVLSASPRPIVPPTINGSVPESSPYSKPPIFGSRIGRVISLLIGLGLFFGMIAAIIYFLTSGRGFVLPDFLNNDTPDIPQESAVTENNPPVAEDRGTNEIPSNTAISSGPTDSDGDGLLDTQEVQAKTDPKKIDTDGDALTDRQEIEIYKTSPLKKDTDSDGFSDGAEVRNFYNPNGDGQLVNVSEAIDAISNTNTR